MRIVFVIVLLLVAGIAARWFVAFTPPISGADPIAELTAVDINGDRQYLLIRGKDRSKPVLLFLHGGPGMPAMYLGHSFQRPLEKDFVVVHWDQRAAGKSYRPPIDPASISTSQLIADAEAVIAHLKTRLGAEKVYLAGHSHGSYLGAILAAHRPDLIEAFVGIGQVADGTREIAIQDAYLKTQLERLGLPADTPITGANREDLLFKTGSEIYSATSFMPLIVAGLKAPEYSLSDVMRVQKGSSFSSTHMTRDMVDGPLMDSVTTFEMPVYFIMGAHDMVTPVSLAREYFDLVESPSKHWIDFDSSAHFPFFEEPERFAETMTRIVEETSAPR